MLSVIVSTKPSPPPKKSCRWLAEDKRAAASKPNSPRDQSGNKKNSTDEDVVPSKSAYAVLSESSNEKLLGEYIRPEVRGAESLRIRIVERKREILSTVNRGTCVYNTNTQNDSIQ